MYVPKEGIHLDFSLLPSEILNVSIISLKKQYLKILHVELTSAPSCDILTPSHFKKNMTKTDLHEEYICEHSKKHDL